jgi:hypothetical protein
MVADQATAQKALPKHRWWLIIAGLMIVLAGGALAQFVRTADGTTSRSDNGPEFIANAVQKWPTKVGVKTL